MPRTIKSGFVGKHKSRDDAGVFFDRSSGGNAHGAFMYRKEKTHAVTCTVPEIGSDLPQGSAHERIELTAEHALRKNGGGKSNVSSQNGCEI